MKAHISVDEDSALVHTRVGTVANVYKVTQASDLLHGEETSVFADAGYQGVAKRGVVLYIKVKWRVVMHPDKRQALDKRSQLGAMQDHLQHIKEDIKAKLQQPFKVSSNGSSATSKSSTRDWPKARPT